MTIPLDWLLSVMLALTRAGAMMTLIPIFSGPIVPARVRLALAAMIAWLVAPGVDVGMEMDWSSGLVAVLLGKEVLAGLMMGFGARMVFFTAEFAGQVMAHESGMSMSAGFDPVSGSTATSFSRLLFFFSSVMLFVTGLHHEIIAAFAASFDVLPAGLMTPGPEGGRSLVVATTQVFVVGMQIAAPVVAMNFLINMVFSVLGKAVSKMNVFLVSFAVRIIVSLWLVTAASGLIAQYLYLQAETAPDLMLKAVAP